MKTVIRCEIITLFNVLLHFMTSQTINREAAKTSGSGLLFQRVRAVQRLLNLIKERGRKACYCATEFIEDSSTLVTDDESSRIAVEENKKYSSALSFNSEAIKNTLVAFADQYINHFNDSKTIDFSVFCHAETADEQIENSILQNISDAIPLSKNKTTKFQLLKKLVNGIDFDDYEISIAKYLFIDEYKKQYSIYSGSDKTKVISYGGHYKVVSQWTDEDFYLFLVSISFIIKPSDSDSFDNEVMECIKDCQFYDHRHYGLEGIILSSLESLFDRRQQDENKFGRFVSREMVEVVFLKVASNQNDLKPIDPAWEIFGDLDVSDQRNLSDKFKDVCQNIKSKRLQVLSVTATKARRNESLFGQEYTSLRCNLYLWCSEYIEASLQLEDYLIDDLMGHLDSMVDICYNNMQQLKKTFRMSIDDKITIKGMILTLIDDCYLAFDEE
ncbi:hypothetical protein J3D56_001842 [Erwinia persicina]|uniref:hypothetical protein n=1 Tax=Erwinia persicina TaxID=55211 RepID=UPI00209E392B|nr:hypothetical protein [Erwinia persicina]MCP1438406.1 hypothetical protein [Erwinia persicina]